MDGIVFDVLTLRAGMLAKVNGDDVVLTSVSRSRIEYVRAVGNLLVTGSLTPDDLYRCDDDAPVFSTPYPLDGEMLTADKVDDVQQLINTNIR